MTMEHGGQAIDLLEDQVAREVRRIRHDEDGAFGVMINKPKAVDAKEGIRNVDG